jgi:GAF domain-containing protein
MKSLSNNIFINLYNVLLKVSKLKEIDEGPFNNALIKICSAACNGLKIERASIWLLDSLNSQISCQFVCSSNGVIQNDTLILKEENFPVYFKALLQERSIVADDAANHPHTKEFKDCYLAPLGITSLLDSPIRVRGNMIGIICCENIGPIKTWRQEEQSFAASLADIVSRAVIAKEKSIAEEKLKAMNNL